jgi:GNAT superfamily N-acetyltransferase
MARDALRMRLDLSRSPQFVPDLTHVTSRQVTTHDAPHLAHVMFMAYQGTTDDEGETKDGALEEILHVFDGTYGPFNWGASMLAEMNGKVVAATLITTLNERPLVAYSFTTPAQQRQGIALMLISRGAVLLRDQGAAELTLAVTRANPAIDLYHRLGFVDDRVE